MVYIWHRYRLGKHTEYQPRSQGPLSTSKYNENNRASWLWLWLRDARFTKIVVIGGSKKKKKKKKNGTNKHYCHRSSTEGLNQEIYIIVSDCWKTYSKLESKDGDYAKEACKVYTTYVWRSTCSKGPFLDIFGGIYLEVYAPRSRLV